MILIQRSKLINHEMLMNCINPIVLVKGYTPYEGINSEEPEVGGIWPEVGGKPLPILFLFSYISGEMEIRCSNDISFIKTK